MQILWLSILLSLDLDNVVSLYLFIRSNLLRDGFFEKDFMIFILVSQRFSWLDYHKSVLADFHF